MKNIIAILLLSLFFYNCGRVGSGSPVLLSKPPLYYPSEAQENGIQGKVVLNLYISQKGVIDSIKLIKSSGFDILDKSALTYCGNLSFMPLNTRGDDNVEYVWTMNYQLESDNPTKSKYVNCVMSLRKKLKENGLDQDKREKIVKIIAYCHDSYGKKINTVKEYNSALALLINREIYYEWKPYWKEFPMHFLVFHEMMNRYECEKDLIMELFDKYLGYDIDYLVYSDEALMVSPDRKDEILRKVYDFLVNHYPDHIPFILDKKFSCLSYHSK